MKDVGNQEGTFFSKKRREKKNILLLKRKYTYRKKIYL